ncbi:MAG TPA: hypothetical protein VEI97_02875 [bacterium]|nr:hypothetical protein [bacterium]
MARGDDVLVISPKKVLRDLVILGVLGFGVAQLVDRYDLLEPLPQPPAEAADGTGAQGPQGSDAILALLEIQSDQVLGTVEGHEVTVGDLDTKVFNVITRGGATPRDDLKPETQRDFMRVQAFFDISREVAQEKAAAERGIAPTEAEIDAEVAAIKESIGGEEKFLAQLKEMGTDEEGMRSLVLRNLRDEALRQQVLAELKVPPESPAADDSYSEWLTVYMRGLDVEITDRAFQENMAMLIQMMGQAPEHGGAGAMANPHAEVPGAPGGPPAPATKEDGPMDTERS